MNFLSVVIPNEVRRREGSRSGTGSKCGIEYKNIIYYFLKSDDTPLCLTTVRGV